MPPFELHAWCSSGRRLGTALIVDPILQLHATAASVARSGNRRPWIADFLGLKTVPARLSSRMEQIIEDPSVLHGRPLQVVRLKPTLGARRLTLVEIEGEAAMARSSAPLVRELDGQRIPSVSFANQVAWHPKHTDAWQLIPFAPSRDNYRAFRAQRLDFKTEHAWIGETDVKNFFPSVPLGSVAAYARDNTGLAKANINKPLTLLRAVGANPGMLPVGPDLASVIGTHLLTPADRWCCWTLGPTAVVRWVDDITFGAPSDEDCRAVLAYLRDGPLKTLGCGLHPAKTHVTPAELWEPEAKLSLFEPEAVVEQRPKDGAQLLTRNEVRYRISEIESDLGDDPEHVAVTIASELPSMLADISTATRTMAKHVDGILTSTVTDAACDALLPHAAATYSDDVAEALLDIAGTRPHLSAGSRQALTVVVSDANVPARTRAAAGWTLAGSGTFDAAALAAVDYIQPYGARALVTAAAHAGHTPSQHELGRAIN